MMILFRPTIPQGLGQFMGMLRFGFQSRGSGGAGPAHTVTDWIDYYRRARRR